MLNDFSPNKLMALCLLMLLAAAAGADEAPFAFKERVLDLHPLRLAEDAAPAQVDETAVDGSWRIVAESDDAVVRHAVVDLSDYFAKSMRVRLRSEVGGLGGEDHCRGD